MANNFTEAFKSVADINSTLYRRWVDQRLEAVQSYGRILADYSSGAKDARKTTDALAKFAIEETTRYTADSWQMAMDYAAALSRTAADSAANGTDKQPVHPPSAAGDDAAPETGTQRNRVHDIKMSGKTGTEACGEFILENPHKQDVAISFQATNYTGADGDIKAAPECDPSDFTLKAGEDKKVTIRTKIDGRKFTAGKSYGANVAVGGFDDMILRVHLAILP